MLSDTSEVSHVITLGHLMVEKGGPHQLPEP